MNSNEFTYWLQGFFELTNTNKLSEQQVEVIKNHLQLVFTKVTPEVSIIDDNFVTDKSTDISVVEILKILEENEQKIQRDMYVPPYPTTPYVNPKPYEDPFIHQPITTCKSDSFC